MWVWSLGQEDPLELEMTTYSSILSWEIPWTEEPSRLVRLSSRHGIPPLHQKCIHLPRQGNGFQKLFPFLKFSDKSSIKRKIISTKQPNGNVTKLKMYNILPWILIILPLKIKYSSSKRSGRVYCFSNINNLSGIHVKNFKMYWILKDGL